MAVITQTDTRTFLTVDNYRIPAEGKGPQPEVDRVQRIVLAVCTSSHDAELICMEGLAYASRTGKYAERAHLYYSLLSAFFARRWEVEVVTPAELKKALCGKGNADKEAVIQSVRDGWSERGWTDGKVSGRSDRADASGLAWIAASRSGLAGVPDLGK